jgi:hypothetical protein
MALPGFLFMIAFSARDGVEKVFLTGKLGSIYSLPPYITIDLTHL